MNTAIETPPSDPEIVPDSRGMLRASLAAMAVGGASLALNLRLIHHPPRYDELYHVLAATSWARDGTLAIAEGEYPRAALFSQLIGLLFRATAPSIDAARIVPAVAGALLVAAVFLWTRANAGKAEGWIAAILLAVSPVALSLATMVRFYTLHALLFFLGAIVAYNLSTQSQRIKSPLLLKLALLTLLSVVCVHLQRTTLIGAAALILWLGLQALPDVLKAARNVSRRRLVLVSLGIAIICGVAAIALSDMLAGLWRTYRFQALWASQSTVLAYHWWLQESYPVFYGLLPAVLLSGLSSHRQATFFCAVIFIAGLFAHSFGGMRGEHYVFYLLPFFLIVCSIATVQAARLLREVTLPVTNTRILRDLPERSQILLRTAVYVTSTFFLVAATPGIYRSLKLLADGPARLHPQYRVDWAAARAELSQAAAQADVVVTTNSLSALYYLGDYHVEMSATILAETLEGTEFSRDRRTGRPVISSAKSLEILMSCYEHGLLIAEDWQWGNGVFGVDRQATELLELNAVPVALPADSRLIAFRWIKPAASIGSNCPDLSRKRPTHS